MHKTAEESKTQLLDVSRVQKLMAQGQKDGNKGLDTNSIIFDEIGGAVKQLDFTDLHKLTDTFLKTGSEWVELLPDIGKVIPKISKFIPQIPGIGMFLGNILGIVSIVEIGLSLVSNLIEQIPAMIGGLITQVINSLINIVGSIFQIIFKIPVLMMNFFTELPKIFINMFLQIFTMIVGLISTYVISLIKAIMAVPMMIISSIAEVLTTIVDALTEAVMNIADLILDFIGQFVKMGMKIIFAMIKLWAFIPIMLVKIASKFLSMMFDLLSELVSEFISFIVETVLAIPIILIKGITKVLTSIFDIGDMVMSLIEGVIKTVFKAIFAIPLLIILFKKIFSATGVQFIRSIGEGLMNFLNVNKDMFKEIISGLIKDFTTYFKPILKEMALIGFNVGAFILKAFKSIGDMLFASPEFKKYARLWTIIVDFTTALITKVGAWLDEFMALGTADEQWKMILSAVDGGLGKLYEAMKPTILKLATELFKELRNIIIEMMKPPVKKAMGAVELAVGNTVEGMTTGNSFDVKKAQKNKLAIASEDVLEFQKKRLNEMIMNGRNDAVVKNLEKITRNTSLTADEIKDNTKVTKNQRFSVGGTAIKGIPAGKRGEG